MEFRLFSAGKTTLYPHTYRTSMEASITAKREGMLPAGSDNTSLMTQFA